MERFVGASLYKITTTNLPLWGDHMMLNESQNPHLLLATNLMANNQLPDPDNKRRHDDYGAFIRGLLRAGERGCDDYL